MGVEPCPPQYTFYPLGTPNDLALLNCQLPESTQVNAPDPDQAALPLTILPIIFVQNLRQWMDLEHRDKKSKPFDFDGWEDYYSDVRLEAT